MKRKLIIFLVVWCLIIYFQEALSSYLFLLLETKGVAIIGSNLHNHIWGFFLLSFFLAIFIATYGFFLFVVFLFSIDYFFMFYVSSFKKHSNAHLNDFFFIEIPSDLVFRVSYFFLIFFLIQLVVITAININKKKYSILVFMILSILFYIPSFSDSWVFVVSFLFLDFFFLLKKLANCPQASSLNRGRIELPASPLSGVRSTNWAIGSSSRKG